MPPSICFDVIGTCFDFSPVIAAISSILSRFASPTPDAETLFFSWFYGAQRDFTYLSLAHTYTPIAKVLSATFPRACAISGLPATSVTTSDISAVMSAFTSMPARPGLVALWEHLQDAGWDVYAVTNGGAATTAGYFEKAGIKVDEQHVISCDAIGVAKPDERVYRNALKVLRDRGVGFNEDGNAKEEMWFVAAHAWDLIAAKKVGFKTAWVGFEEKVSCVDIFGRFDWEGEGFEALLEKMRQVV